MKKKFDEGYSLPLVLVVMAVLAALASGLMTVVMRNMEAQQSSVAIMQNQYAAQGKLEMVIAELCQFDFADAQGATTTSQTIIKNKVTELCENNDVEVPVFGEYILGNAENSSFTATEETLFEKEFSLDITLTAINESVKVIYDVTYSGYVSETVEEGRGYYLITAPEITYHSYKADMVTGGNGT